MERKTLIMLMLLCSALCAGQACAYNVDDLRSEVAAFSQTNHSPGAHSSYQQSVLGGEWFGYNYAGFTPWGGGYFFSLRWRLW